MRETRPERTIGYVRKITRVRLQGTDVRSAMRRTRFQIEKCWCKQASHSLHKILILRNFLMRKSKHTNKYTNQCHRSADCDFVGKPAPNRTIILYLPLAAML